MKMISKIAILFLMLFSAATVFAAPDPPVPAQSTAKNANVSAAEPFPSGDIDDDLLTLMFFGLSLGAFAIYKHKLKTKASV